MQLLDKYKPQFAEDIIWQPYQKIIIGIEPHQASLKNSMHLLSDHGFSSIDEDGQRKRWCMWNLQMIVDILIR